MTISYNHVLTKKHIPSGMQVRQNRMQLQFAAGQVFLTKFSVCPVFVMAASCIFSNALMNICIQIITVTGRKPTARP
jgi:hypothetical protein